MRQKGAQSHRGRPQSSRNRWPEHSSIVWTAGRSTKRKIWYTMGAWIDGSIPCDSPYLTAVTVSGGRTAGRSTAMPLLPSRSCATRLSNPEASIRYFPNCFPRRSALILLVICSKSCAQPCACLPGLAHSLQRHHPYLAFSLRSFSLVFLLST